jgi:hypothetical protein
MAHDLNKPLFQYTASELIEVLQEAFPSLKSSAEEKPESQDGPTFTGRCAFGVADICAELRISRKTFYNWKPWLGEAIRQAGRKPVLDLEYAFKLMERQGVKSDQEK